MNETLQDRIRKRLEITGRSPNGASEAAGLSRETVRKFLERPNGSLNAQTLRKLAPVLETTVQWLSTGEGDEDASAAARYLPPEIVENVVFALHQSGAFATSNSQGAADLVVYLANYMMENPDLAPEKRADVISFAAEKLRRTGA